MGEKGRWEETYERTGGVDVSWFQTEPAISLRLLSRAGLSSTSSVVDVGGGASPLADRLVAAGVSDVTVLDLAEAALATVRQRVPGVTLLAQDVLTWQPPRRFDLWHDRAVFHFLTTAASRDAYRRVLATGLAEHRHVVIGTFAEDGPTTCSGLPVCGYSPEQLAAEFADFAVVQAEREEHHTPWGSVQPFTWLLLRRS